MEKIVQTKQCKHCSASFEITDKDLEFYDKVSPKFNGIKYSIPTPTLCPDCRQQRRLSFRNERKLYKRKCDATGEDIISIYSPNKPYKVYNQDFWWSDKWDPLDYGKDFDFSKSFFEQFEELIIDIPHPSLLNTGHENSEYVNYSSYLKNSYLVFDSTYGENLFYGNASDFCGNCIDFSNTNQCKECYCIYNCNNSYMVFYSLGCNNSSNLNYVFDSNNSHNCFLSHTLHNKSYIFENKQYNKDEYEELVNSFYKLSKEEKEKKIKKLEKIYKEEKNYLYSLSISSENSYGSYLFNVKNAYSCYLIQKGNDIKYCSNSINLQNSYDTDNVGEGAELCYEINATMKMYKSFSCFGSWGESLNYCDKCSFCNDLFGCIGLRNKSYCILNKQYTKEEYETLVPKIIEHMSKTGEWGEFFPSSISPFGYNETVAIEYFPLEKNDAIKIGFKWSDYEPPKPNVSKIIPASKLPDKIEDIPDDILNWAIECEITKKPYRIIKQELDFYRKHNLPIPRRHPDQRHLDRMKLRNPRKLFDRKCDKCGKDMKTTYAPERPEIVYCEECYNKEVY